jgi:hypothetical protein
MNVYCSYKNNWSRGKVDEANQHVWQEPMPKNARVAIIGGTQLSVLLSKAIVVTNCLQPAALDPYIPASCFVILSQI